MTALKHAFQSAGIALPPGKTQYERIWLRLRDHPHQTADEVAAALQIKLSSVHGALHDMLTQRGMAMRRRGTRFSKGVWEYSAVGTVYELLPRKKAARSPEGVSACEKKAIAQAAAERAEPLATSAARPAFDIEAYTLGELRAIHQQLSQLFGRS